MASRVQLPLALDALERKRNFQDFLRAEVRLALVVAGPGFGKTQWVARWARLQNPPPAWLTLGHREDDAHQFLVYLRAAWLRAFPDTPTEALDRLLSAGFLPDRWRAAADHLGSLWESQGGCLVIDDLHHLQGEALHVLEYLIQFSPPEMGWVLLARQVPELEFLAGWRSRGWVLEVGPEDLRFQAAELEALGLGPEVFEATAGWPMAVDSLRRSGRGAAQAEALLEQVWRSLSPELQELLVRTSVFEYVASSQVASLCPHLDWAGLLQEALAQGVFLQPYGPKEYRFHPLARSFLLRQLRTTGEGAQSSHQAAAPVALSLGEYDEALWHLFEAGAHQEAASLLHHWAPLLLQQGAFLRLQQYLEQLPEGQRDASLGLYYAQALASGHRFEKALEEFLKVSRICSESSLRAQALLGAGKVLVDTLQPSGAKALLRQAYPDLSREQKNQVLLLLAENSLNQGAHRQARRYRQLALPEGGARDRLEVRLLLRSGELDQARARLLQEADGGGEGHRNEGLLLAYLAALQGDATSAEFLSRASLRQAQAAQEAFAESVAWMRLGHALQLKSGSDPQEIRHCYLRARQLTETMGTPRLRAEALMGEALFCAHQGDWARSYDASLEALSITREAGDVWMSAWLQLTSGIAARTGLHPGWRELLQASLQQFHQVQDRFGVFLAEYWLDPDAVGPQASERGFGFVMERATLFGPRHRYTAPAAKATTEVAPALRICVLGPLQVFRKGEEVPHSQWKRKKARELLGILLSLRGGLVAKERLWDQLFPESSPQAAARDLRVLLHALFEVLDPERPHNAPARYVVRRDDHYGLPWAENWSLDLADFEHFLGLAQQASDPEESLSLYQKALDLVRGDYLQEFPYADWAAAPRERWKQQYFEACGRVADFHLQRRQWESVSQVAHLMLQRDRCWEQGYQLLMQVHLEQGRPAQAARVYDQCRQALEEDLGVEPSEVTEELYAQALG